MGKKNNRKKSLAHQRRVSRKKYRNSRGRTSTKTVQQPEEDKTPKTLADLEKTLL